ncbi:mannose-ethanolamine phosphotransferase [Saccharomycopsis crataegensis]|uniref:GPI ethanolamine phosphate transferase 2 n=1 Tax=Saccharomycopsis crataegensis TaxID=43959 RepID=A0AAV5QFV6_9ASCO|nr:mannose-ethanolamine phosphotransferase [Saccharomycopsis crataegensis]
MKLGTRWSIILFLTVIQYIGFLLFAKGFFPQKVLLPGINSLDSINDDSKSPIFSDILSKSNHKNPNNEKFDKLIFIVIDALRSDFMFSSNSSMFHLHDLLNNNAAIGFTGFSNPPTVTLPRLKGITTGSTSSFLDAILNINEDDTSSSSNLVNQDSWLKQFKISKRKDSEESGIHFFGDDTWLKLFPGFFDKHDGTSSFFVSDFTEVDNNVTRHINAELANDQEWDGLILHYLGLDHIGHKNGPNSVFMPAKQRELDDIIYKIYSQYAVPKYEKPDSERVLMVVLGDHGMNEIGNHGGSSISETSAALAFISPIFEKENSNYLDLSNKDSLPIPPTDDYQFLDSVNQIDLIPTLCNFFQLPIPKNNLGVILKKFLLKTNSSGQLNFVDIFYKLLENSYQFKNLIQVKFGKELTTKFDPTRKFNDDSEFELLDFLWHDSVLKAEQLYSENEGFADCDSSELLKVVENFYKFLYETQEFLQNSSTNYDVPLLMKSITIIATVTIILLVLFFKGISCSTSSFFVIFTLTMGISTFGSSMIEEEHQTWWLFNLIHLIYLSIGLVKSYSFSVKRSLSHLFANLVFFRMIRFWNPSGQKFNFLPEFVELKLSHYLSTSYKVWALWILFVVVFAHSQIISNGGIRLLTSSVSFVIPFTLSLVVLTFKVNFDYVNTGGKHFNQFFKVMVDKTSSFFVNPSLSNEQNDNKEMLIILAQVSFILILSVLAIRVLLLKCSFLWIDRVIEKREEYYEKKNEVSDEAIIKTQLISNKGKKKNKQMTNQLRKVSNVKRTIIDGKFRFLSDVVNTINILLIMQSKLENVGLYLVFFVIRELGLKLINSVISRELEEAAKENKPTDLEETEQAKLAEEIRIKSILINKEKFHLKLAFYVTIQTILLQNLSFFQFSFTNSLSTVDLANAYNGTRSYNLVLVGLLTFVSNFSSAIYWSFNSLVWLFENNLINSDRTKMTSSILFDKTSPSIKWEMFYVRYLTQLLFYSFFGLFLCVSCFNLRYHLFIWTVFSPKLLFFGVWNFLINGLAEVFIAFILYLL